MTLGKSLVSARTNASLSIDELSNQTNIRVTLLKEFEANNFRNAGGDTYARGHLRTIARVCQVDSEILLTLFDEEHAHAKRAIHEQLVENNATFALAHKSKITQKQLIVVSLIGIFMVLGISIAINNSKPSSSAPKASTSLSASPSNTTSQTPIATPKAIPATNVYSSGQGVSVKLEAVHGSSWLFVSDAAGITLYSGNARDGQIFEFSSTEEVNLRIGNAGAVKLTVNGHEIESLGINGEVVNVSYGVNS